MSGKKQKYSDRTPIGNLIPSNYKPASQEVPFEEENVMDESSLQRTSSESRNGSENKEMQMSESTNKFSPQEIQNIIQPQIQSSHQIPDTDIERLLEDLPEECEDESLIDKLKKYVKVVLILVVIFVLVSNKYILQFLNTNIGNLTVSTTSENHLIPTTSGIFVQGSILGIIYVIVSSLLIYIGFL